MKIPKANIPLLIVLICILCAVEGIAQPAWQWMRSIGGGIAGSNGQKDNLMDFTTDRWGNSYIAGSFWYDVDIDTIHLDVPGNVFSSREASNAYVAKFDCAGRVQWVSHWKGAAGAVVRGIETHKDYLYAFGRVSTGSNYPAYVDDTLILSGGFNLGRDLLIKYDLFTGEKLQIKILPVNFINFANPDEIKISQSGNFYFPYRAVNDFPYQNQTIPAGVGIVKTDSAMNYIDHVAACTGCQGTVNSPSNAVINKIDFDEQGNVYVSAAADSSVHTLFGIQVDYGRDHKVGMIVKLDNNFDLRWFEQSYIIGTQQIGGVALPLIGKNNNLYARTFSKACYQLLNSCAIFQGDTAFTQYPNGVKTSFGINKYDKETGVLNWTKRMDHDILTPNTVLMPARYSAINHTKDTLFYSGYSSLGGGKFYWDNDTIIMLNHNIFTLRFDTLGNLLGYDTIPYDPNNGASFNTFLMQLTSNSTMYLAGHHNYGIHFPDSTFYPLNGSGSNMRDIWIAKYGTDGPCFRCDSIRPDFTVEQYLGNTARVVANNTKHAEAGSYHWDFGYGNQTSNAELPTMTITYPDTGYYQVCLSAKNFCDSASACKQVYIGCPKPIVEGFALSFGNNNIQVNSVKLYQYDSFEWDFGDGSISSDSFPFHQYANSGNYEICLTAENSCGTAQYCETVEIKCPAPQIAEWTYALDNLDFHITDAQVSSYDSLHWDFGDGNSSTAQEPQNHYEAIGQYQVCLYAHNSCGSTFACEQIAVLSTGILSLENGGSIKVYPNPTAGELNIEAHNVKGAYRIALVNMQGQTLLEERFSGNGQRISLEEYSSGFYFLKFYNKKSEYAVAVLKE